MHMTSDRVNYRKAVLLKLSSPLFTYDLYMPPSSGALLNAHQAVSGLSQVASSTHAGWLANIFGCGPKLLRIIPD